MKTRIRQLIRNVAIALGYDIVRYRPPDVAGLPLDLSADDRAVIERIAGFTMTSIDRQIALVQAVRHIVRSGIPGCFVECGVWRGGSAMAVAMTLAQEGDTTRDLFLFDTFEGMSPPTAEDQTLDGVRASSLLAHAEKNSGVWCYADLNDVRANMASMDYPPGKIHYVKGAVEVTLPGNGPNVPIALLRLDTDWYESTRHEMVHLFPRLHKGGVLIVDDYGHWQGARKAVDEYLARQERRYFLHRIDYTGRLLIKQ
jgi:O-methyltransferase